MILRTLAKLIPELCKGILSANELCPSASARNKYLGWILDREQPIVAEQELLFGVMRVFADGGKWLRAENKNGLSCFQGLLHLASPVIATVEKLESLASAKTLLAGEDAIERERRRSYDYDVAITERMGNLLETK